MNLDPSVVLRKYWGFDQFRGVQEAVIQSVLSRNDTLALLPTGGGKSICFQIPAMCLDGICIVVSPLIALMKDQVSNLKSKGIKAAAIHSGMDFREIDLTLDNCIYGDYKFLYLSPERLLSEIFIERLSKMNVNLIAVDESHCISQWGYDFRPPYMHIADLRDLLPGTPVLALTASATPDVQNDIMGRLKFKNENIFKQSFVRKNLAYLVYHSANKIEKLLELLSKSKGSGIVYVRNRKKCREIAEFLNDSGISANYYHAGLTHVLREERQEAWKQNKTRIIVCTNAFGMGIDKPDVQMVIHMDLPDNPESYFQEAGRAGRNGNPAFAILLYNKSDIDQLKLKCETNFPELSEIKKVYQALANFLQVPVGATPGTSYDFDITRFIETYKLDPLKTISALRTLENEDLLTMSESVFMPSRIRFISGHNDLYSFMVANPVFDSLIKTILRTSEGVFEDYVRINENELVAKTGFSTQEILRKLKYLENAGVVYYLPRKDAPQITFSTPREDPKYITIDMQLYRMRKARFIAKADTMISYVSDETRCKSIMLVSYFGETGAKPCGICSFCKTGSTGVRISKNQQLTYENIILKSVENGPSSPAEIIKLMAELTKEQAAEIIADLVDRGKIVYSESGKLRLP